MRFKTNGNLWNFKDVILTYTLKDNVLHIVQIITALRIPMLRVQTKKIFLIQIVRKI
jgi:hypothetical protein